MMQLMITIILNQDQNQLSVMHTFGWKLVSFQDRNLCDKRYSLLDDMKGGGRIMDVDVDDQFHNRNGLDYGGDIADHIKCKENEQSKPK